jgi:hypothetical protein
LENLYGQSIYYTFAKNYVAASMDMENWGQTQLSVPDELVIESIQSLENLAYAYTTTGEIYWFSIQDSSQESSWQLLDANYEYPVVSVLGYMKSNDAQQAGLAVIVNKEGEQTLAFLPNAFSTTAVPKNFSYGEKVPDNFPVSGFSTINNKSLILEKITLVGGKNQAGEIVNTVWATEDGLHWSELSTNPLGNLPVIDGGNAFVYNNELWFMGGKYVNAGDENTAGEYNKYVFYSIDGGLVWKTKANKVCPPEEFGFRQDASVVTDKESKSFYIVGGLNQTDIWKATLNSKQFGN